jgi:hypothetical protein
MFSARVETGTCCITAFIGFWDLGIEDEVWEVAALEERADG